MTLALSLLLKADAGQATAALKAVKGDLAGVQTAAVGMSSGTNTASTSVKTLTIAADSAAAELTQLASAESRAATTAGELRTAHQGAAGSVGNLVSQFNDIGMMIAAGQNPLQLAIQQGSQITQVIGPMGAGGAVKALGGALLGMLNPVNLVTYAVIAGGAAFVQWAMSGEEAAIDLGDAIEALGKSMDSYKKFADLSAASTAELAKRFGDFAGQVKGFAEYMKGVSLGTVLTDMDAAIDPLKGKLATVVDLLDQAKAIKEEAGRTQLLVDQGLVDPMQILYAKNAMEVLQAQAADTAASMGLLPEQATALATALDELGAASGVSQIRDEAADALALIQGWYPAGAALSPELATVASYLNDIVTKSADATSQEVAMSDALELAGGAVARLAAIAADLPGYFSSADGAVGGLAATLAKAASNAWALAQARYGTSGREGRLETLNAGMTGRGQPATDYDLPKGWDKPPKVKSGGASAAKAERDAVAELIAKLEDEAAIQRELDLVKAEMLKHRKDLAKATTEERARVEELIRAEQQLKQVEELNDFMNTSTMDLLKGLVAGGDEATNAMKRLGNAILDAAMQALLLGKGPLAGVLGISGGLFSAGTGAAKGTGSLGLPKPFADGGMIFGAGGPRDDKIPMWGSAGEYMVNARATAKYKPLLDRINYGGDVPGFANGGMIGGGKASGALGKAERALEVHNHIYSATGNTEIHELVLQATKAGIEEYDREAMPYRVKDIVNHQRKVG